jgi:hypothetical protein
MEEALPSETAGTPELPSTTVLETRVGGPVDTRLPLRASRGGDFNVCHFCPRSTGVICSLTPFVPTLEKTPRSKFRGVFPFSSSGCMGTMPVLPPWRTNTAVTGR